MSALLLGRKDRDMNDSEKRNKNVFILMAISIKSASDYVVRSRKGILSDVGRCGACAGWSI
jgi:hypothetical protein